MRSIKILYQIVIIILMFVILHGCTYVLVRTKEYPTYEEVRPHFNYNKTYVVHTDTGFFLIDRVSILGDSILAKYSGKYIFTKGRYNFPDPNSHIVFEHDNRILNEVHFWVPFVQSAEEKYIKISMEDIYRFDVYSYDKRMLGWSILGTILIPPVIILFLIGFG